MTTETKVEFETALQSFVQMAQTKANEGAVEINQVVITLERGRRYYRVVKAYARDPEGSRSLYCFIDQDGSVLKGDGWKKPAKGIRGNILNPDNGSGAVGRYGANYAR